MQKRFPDDAKGHSAGVAGRGAAMADYEPVTYNYAWFHLIFSLASMYIAMLMTGWGSGAEEKVCPQYPETTGSEHFVPRITLDGSSHTKFVVVTNCKCDMFLPLSWSMSAWLQNLLDVSWLSVGVKLTTELFTAALFLWTLAAPALFPDRDFA